MGKRLYVGNLAWDTNEETLRATFGFDASIHIFFVDQAAHDAYITDPRHVGFVERFRDSWSYVKVCDSLVEARLDP